MKHHQVSLRMSRVMGLTDYLGQKYLFLRFPMMFANKFALFLTFYIFQAMLCGTMNSTVAVILIARIILPEGLLRRSVCGEGMATVRSPFFERS